MKQLPLKQGRMGLYLSLLIGILAFMFCLRQCSQKRVTGWDDSRPGGDTINIGIEYSPLAVMSADGDSLSGFGYELMSLLAKENGYNVNFHPIVKLNKALERLDSGYYDVVIAELPVTAELRENLRFSEPVFLDRQVLIQRRDSLGMADVASPLDLGKRRVTVVSGSAAAERLRNLSREIGDTIIVESDTIHSPEQIFLLTAAGRIPLAVISASTAQALAPGYPEVDVSTAVSFSQFRSWMLTRKNPELADSLDAALRRFKATDAYTRLLEKYSLLPAD